MRRWLYIGLAVLLIGCGQALKATSSEVAPSTKPAAAPTIDLTALITWQPVPAYTPQIPTPTNIPIPTPIPDAWPNEQALALRPEFAGDATHSTMPRYAMQITLEPNVGRYSGSQIITYTNTTGASINSLVLRSYNNFPPDAQGDGGDTTLEVTKAWSNGNELNLAREAENTAFRLNLATSLAPNQQVVISTQFAGTIKAWPDGSYPLLSAYPMLAVWDAAANDWRMDVTRFPDRVFAETALYRVQLKLPAEYQVIGAGTLLEQNADRTSRTYVSGPVREWAAALGQFSVSTSSIDGIDVNAYGPDYLDLARVREMAIGALTSYQAKIGAYPYRKLDLHVMPWDSGGGIEYPAYTIILVNDGINRDADYVVFHEVAHQWWYGLLGNDVYREAWLDEAMASYLTYVATQDVLGQAAADSYYSGEIERLALSNQANGNWPAGLAINQYPSFNSYYRAVYGKGAAMLHQLRIKLGDQSFFQGLAQLNDQKRYQIITRSDFQSVMEQSSGQALGEWLDGWLNW
ncbi:MAG TPA: M1 family peptidase [Herpetosiphon sp.]|uniref:Peptidase M1 membrane alanine aminopeptidase n=1 Tax=Herpetosiphon aurantiacus (strain ATCC 23779 / DSM 785 / 114-95) TaxID=316274 RepID=A9AW00_HERA2|nr:M1 family metallopeptidase [Herpetosiphon sp.]ABX03238.1 Peptidase M1 membrane alanine aminopeptidase [Herpetosiphon aurantiacus DSM 785]HBW52533.1 M1 family peptidase [Herpetosiphon sp.]